MEYYSDQDIDRLLNDSDWMNAPVPDHPFAANMQASEDGGFGDDVPDLSTNANLNASFDDTGNHDFISSSRTSNSIPDFSVPISTGLVSDAPFNNTNNISNGFEVSAINYPATTYQGLPFPSQQMRAPMTTTGNIPAAYPPQQPQPTQQVQQAHSTKRSIRCPTCHRPFARKCDMDRHTRKHDPRKAEAFKCHFPECGNRKGFPRKDKLSQHLRQVHKLFGAAAIETAGA